ncbi:MAG: hypothetical protein ACRAS9_02610 [Mycoplasma sp.]
MKTKKLNLNKKSKALISLGAAVTLLAGLGVTLGETLTHKNNSVTYSKANLAETDLGPSTPAPSTSFVLPNVNDVKNWYNNLYQIYAGKSGFNYNMIRTIFQWQKISDLSDNKEFDLTSMHLPNGFTPVAVAQIWVFVPNKVQTQTHFLAIDENYNILDLAKQDLYGAHKFHWVAGVKGVSQYTDPLNLFQKPISWIVPQTSELTPAWSTIVPQTSELTPAWSTLEPGYLPKMEYVKEWYNNLYKAFMGRYNFNFNVMESINRWQNISDFSNNKQFDLASMKLPEGFTPIALAKATVFQPKQMKTQTHYLAIDAKFNIVDLSKQTLYGNDSYHFVAGLKNSSQFTDIFINYYQKH